MGIFSGDVDDIMAYGLCREEGLSGKSHGMDCLCWDVEVHLVTLLVLHKSTICRSLIC